jgi:hypothetical protein
MCLASGFGGAGEASRLCLASGRSPVPVALLDVWDGGGACLAVPGTVTNTVTMPGTLGRVVVCLASGRSPVPGTA